MAVLAGSPWLCCRVSMAVLEGLHGSVAGLPWQCCRVSMAVLQGLHGSAAGSPWLLNMS